MIVKLQEVYRNTSMSNRKTPGPTWSTREVFINTEHIVLIRPNSDMSRRLNEGLIEGLTGGSQFCTVSINKGQAGTDITVVGSVVELEKTVKKTKREILNG